jgi:hypothetical protein
MCLGIAYSPSRQVTTFRFTHEIAADQRLMGDIVRRQPVGINKAELAEPGAPRCMPIFDPRIPHPARRIRDRFMVEAVEGHAMVTPNSLARSEIAA